MTTLLQKGGADRLRPRWVSYPHYKPTGIDWLGHIPGHWIVKPLKRLVSIRAGENITALAFDDNGEYPVYGGNGIRGYTTKFTHNGDFVLIGRQGALCGNVHRVHGRFWASEHAAVATCRDGIYADWLAYLIEKMDLKRHSETAAQPGLALERVVRLPVPLPQLDEQRAIAAFLDGETAKIDGLLAGCTASDSAVGVMARMARLLIEYRSTLISAAVTGQIDVRNYHQETTCP